MDPVGTGAPVDVPTLRRIALLALRIGQELNRLKRLLTRTVKSAFADSAIAGSPLAELRDLGRALRAD